MTLKERVKAEAQREKEMQETVDEINKKDFLEVGSHKESEYEVKFFEKDLARCGAGIGVRLVVSVYKNDSLVAVVWDSIVRGNSRYGDDFYHWYRDCEKIEEREDGMLLVTLSSSLLEDTYKINNNQVVLVESLNLEELRKEMESKKLLEEADAQENLEEKARKKTYAYATKLECSGTRDPKVYDGVILKNGIIVNLIGIYRSGYDPAMKEIIIMIDGEEYKKIDLEDFYNPYNVPKYSSTFFVKEDIIVENDEILLKGRIIQRNSSGSGFYNPDKKLAEIEVKI